MSLIRPSSQSVFPVKLVFALFLGALMLASCSSTRYVQDGEYLLVKNKIEINTKRIEKGAVDAYIKQYPNTSSIFGIRFKLAAYNMSKDTSQCKFFVNRWLRTTVGQPPVILDTALNETSKQSIGIYLRSIGYYDFTIRDSVHYKGKKKANVVYSIDVKSPLRLKKLFYEIEDPKIAELVEKDSLATLLYPGRPLASSTLESERDRISRYLRNRGYYEFNKSNISYQADSTIGSSRVNLTMKISNPKHRRFFVRDMYVCTDYDAIKGVRDTAYLSTFDTIRVSGVGYLYQQKLPIRPSTIRRVNLVEMDAIYSERDVNQTYTNLSNLGVYRAVTIRFREDPDSLNAAGDTPLVCEILLSPADHQGFKVDFEISTNSSGLWSFAPSVGYNNLNLFKGAELFQISTRGAIQRYIPGERGYRNSKELYITTSIEEPKFRSPIKPRFSRRNIPHTVYSISYGYQTRPNFTRQTAGGTFGYSWRTANQASIIFNPIEITLVEMMNIDSLFAAKLKRNPYLENMYRSHFIGGGMVSYSKRTASRDVEYSKVTQFLRLSLDVAGNTLSLFNSMLAKADDGSRKIFGSSYAQFAKVDINYSFNRRLTSATNMVYHVYFGIGKPYGNSKTLPLEKMFFGGGANSLRGWQVRTIGPGAAMADSISIVPSQVGDLTAELNLEYRFKLFSYLEGATFLDVGNVWSLIRNDPREGARFTFNTFYRQLATNTGLGVRLNLSFIVVRVDMGFKIYDPILVEKTDAAGNQFLQQRKFIAPYKWLKRDNFAIHFALNYPF